MAQAIKYQSTTIVPSLTATQIAELVRQYGGTRFEIKWDREGELEGIRFSIRSSGVGELPVILTAPINTILDILEAAEGPRSTKTRRDLEPLARRIAWRHMKDLSEQLLLSVHLGLQTLASAFMASIEVWDEEKQETVPMAEMFARKAQLAPGEQGVRFLTRGKGR